MAKELLSQADGYGIIIGLSVLFCLIIIAAVRIQKRYLSEDSDQSEMFMVANRSVGTGLTASAVFSSWYSNRLTWHAGLVQADCDRTGCGSTKASSRLPIPTNGGFVI
jgi:hypothetical protein